MRNIIENRLFQQVQGELIISAELTNTRDICYKDVDVNSSCSAINISEIGNVGK